MVYSFLKRFYFKLKLRLVHVLNKTEFEQKPKNENRNNNILKLI